MSESKIKIELRGLYNITEVSNFREVCAKHYGANIEDVHFIQTGSKIPISYQDNMK